MQKPTSVGLLGCGYIASVLALRQNKFKIESVYDNDTSRLRLFSEKYSVPPCSGIDELLASPAEIIAENASPEMIKTHAAEILRAGKDLLITSTAPLADPEIRQMLTEEAEKTGAKIRIPSGILAGLDSIHMRNTGIASPVRLKITAPPEVFGITNSISPCIFSGNLHNCAETYPENSRIAAALAAAGRDTSIELWADPALAQIVTELSFAGENGDVYTRTSSAISRKKPEEIPAIALSVVTALENIRNPFILGA